MSMSAGRVLSINIAGTFKSHNWLDGENRTGIDKKSVEGLVDFSNDRVAGDHVSDTTNHGGYDKAIYSYAREDAIWWESIIGKEIAYGQFGENLTTQGVDITGAIIGERWRIGEVLLEVSEPRIPCRIFAGFWDRPTLIKEFTEANRPGTYLRILEEGMFERKSHIDVIYQPDHGITVGDLFAARSGTREKIAEIANVQELSLEYKQWANRVLESLSK
jgi:MOSC domain-containing protein YiiM